MAQHTERHPSLQSAATSHQ